MYKFISGKYLTRSCCPVKGASGAHTRNISTKQHAVQALTPLSLCASRFGLTSSVATRVKDARSTSSCSISLISLERACSLRKSSLIAIGLPTLHESGSLNCKFGSASAPAWPVLAIGAELVALEGIVEFDVRWSKAEPLCGWHQLHLK